MKLLYSLSKIKAFFFGPIALLALVSCSSYQYAGYESDGIYSSETPEAYTSNEIEESYEDALHYEQIFATNSERFEDISEEGSIFTNIDSYSSVGSQTEADFAGQEISYGQSYGAWGTDVDEIDINFYGNHFYDPFLSYGPFMNPYMQPYYGYSYMYDYRWPYGYGFNYYSPWNHGWGYRYNSWGMGYAYNPYYYGYHGYYRNYVPLYYTNPRNVAYNSGRRNSSVDYSPTYSRSNSSQARSSRIADYSNSRNVRAVRSYNVDDNERTYRTRSTRVESPERAQSSRTYRSSTERTSSPARVRTTRNRTSSPAPQVRRTNTPTRSSGSVRSSSSNRSSGVRSTSTRTTRGRG
ncbi:MAG TPA: hypothetical protein VFM59_00130 [Salinimicrobium sp.]|nr:hypothetical protein [Salinimicrobium sp.]